MASNFDSIDILHADDDSRQGAASLARRAAHNARLIVVKLIEQYPKKSKDDLFKLFRVELEDDIDLQRAVALYFFTNMYQAEFRQPAAKRGPKPGSKPTYKEMRAAQEARKDAIKAKILSVLTLDFIMPSGALLRDCTGDDCIKAGGDFAKIGKQVGLRRKVGDAIRDDAALAALLTEKK